MSEKGREWRKITGREVYDFGQAKIVLEGGEVIGGDWEFRPVNIYRPIDQNDETFVEIKLVFRCPTNKVFIEKVGKGEEDD